jgi:dolichol kinase
MRESEESGTFRLSGTTYMMGGFFLSALFFSKELAITSWLILIISDPLAALVGIKIGTRKINDKTLEGCAAFLISSLFISILSYYFLKFNTSFFVIVVSCVITTLLEFYSKKINVNDNFLIPLGYGFTTIIFNFLLSL